MEVKRVCNKCGKTNMIDSTNLTKMEVYDDEGTFYKIMFIVCQNCFEKDVVQIDDVETLRMFRELKKITIKTARKNLKGETISPKDIKKKDKLTKSLRKKRAELQKLCYGKKLYNENKKVIVERLTFPEVGDIIESNL